MKVTRLFAAAGLAALVSVAGILLCAGPKSGGTLTLRFREDLPQGFAINESPRSRPCGRPCRASTTWCSSTRGSRPTAPRPSSASSPSGGRGRTATGARLLPSQGVKWHDGKPFTARTSVDLRHPPGVARGAGQLRLNPRREWYANVEAVEAPDPLTVVFRLKRPQPRCC